MSSLKRRRISHHHRKQYINFHFALRLLINLQYAHKLDSLVRVFRWDEMEGTHILLVHPRDQKRGSKQQKLGKSLRRIQRFEAEATYVLGHLTPCQPRVDYKFTWECTPWPTRLENSQGCPQESHQHSLPVTMILKMAQTCLYNCAFVSQRHRYWP